MERNYGQVLPNTPNYVFDAMFARLVYDYNYKYVFSGSVRRDRSSKFGPDKRAGWILFGFIGMEYNRRRLYERYTLARHR
mgnify:CR=1 FL=1